MMVVQGLGEGRRCLEGRPLRPKDKTTEFCAEGLDSSCTFAPARGFSRETPCLGAGSLVQMTLAVYTFVATSCRVFYC